MFYFTTSGPGRNLARGIFEAAKRMMKRRARISEESDKGKDSVQMSAISARGHQEGALLLFQNRTRSTKILRRLFQPICPEKTVAHAYFLDGRTDTLGGLVGFGNSTIVMDALWRLPVNGFMKTKLIVVQ